MPHPHVTPAGAREHGADGAASAGSVTLVLPVPPSINHQYATVNGRRVLSKAGREFKTLAAAEVAAWIAHHPEVDVTLFQRHYLALKMTFYFLSALRRDLDSGLKIAQDALCESLGVNDNLVIDIHLTKRVDRQAPRMEVQLTALMATSMPLEGEDAEPRRVTLPAPPPRRRARRRPPQRSLEELAVRHRWE